MSAHTNVEEMANWFDFIFSHQPAAREDFFGQPFGPGRTDPNCGWTVRQKNWDKFH
jgi:hypothetical protein